VGAGATRLARLPAPPPLTSPTSRPPKHTTITPTQVKVQMLDFSGATDVRTLLEGDPGALDRAYVAAAAGGGGGGGGHAVGLAALAARGVRPAAKRLVLDTGRFTRGVADAGGRVGGWLGTERQEGLAILDACTLALAEDNNYGLDGNGPSRLSEIALGVCLPEAHALLAAEREGAFFGGLRRWGGLFLLLSRLPPHTKTPPSVLARASPRRTRGNTRCLVGLGSAHSAHRPAASRHAPSAVPRARCAVPRTADRRQRGAVPGEAPHRHHPRRSRARL